MPVLQFFVGMGFALQNLFEPNQEFLADFLSDCLAQKGTKAPQAAGKIHTDFEKGFIMAEVMKFDDFKELGSEAAVKVKYFGNIIFKVWLSWVLGLLCVCWTH